MATGTGNLPASNDSTSPFQILTSEHMNNIKANIDALADGSGLGDGGVAADKLDWTTLLKLSGSLTGTIPSITTTPQAIGTIVIPAGYSNVAVDIDGIFEINHNNSAATDYTCNIEKNSVTLRLGVMSATTGQYFISKTVQTSTTVSTGDTIRFLIARGGGSGGVYNSGRSTYRISQ